MSKAKGNSSNQTNAPNRPAGKTVVSHISGANWTERLDAARARRNKLRAQASNEGQPAELIAAASVDKPVTTLSSSRGGDKRPAAVRAARLFLRGASRDVASGTLVAVSLCSMVIGFALGASSQDAPLIAAAKPEQPDLAAANPPVAQQQTEQLIEPAVEEAVVDIQAGAEEAVVATALMAKEEPDFTSLLSLGSDKLIPETSAIPDGQPVVAPAIITTWDFTESDGPSQGMAPSLVVEPVWQLSDPDKAAKANILAVAPEADVGPVATPVPVSEETMYAMPVAPAVVVAAEVPADAPSYGASVDAILAALAQAEVVEPTLEEAPVPAPTTGPLKARVYAPTSIAYASLDGTLDQIVQSGAEVSQIERIDMQISTPHIRYFYAQDADRAVALGQSLNLDVRNFEHVAAGGAGGVEVWLQGDPWERAVIVEEEQASVRRPNGLARVFGASW